MLLSASTSCCGSCQCFTVKCTCVITDSFIIATVQNNKFVKKSNTKKGNRVSDSGLNLERDQTICNNENVFLKILFHNVANMNQIFVTMLTFKQPDSVTDNFRRWNYNEVKSGI